MIDIKEILSAIYEKFKPGTRLTCLALVLCLLDFARAVAADCQTRLSLKNAYIELADLAQSEGHYAVATLVLLHGKRLIVTYGTSEEATRAQSVLTNYKTLPLKDRAKYNISEAMYDQLADYVLGLIRQYEDSIEEGLTDPLQPADKKDDVDALVRAVYFVNAIPVPMAYIVAKHLPLGAGGGKIVVQSKILKFAYLKVRFMETAVKFLAANSSEGWTNWAEERAEMATYKFRFAMKNLKKHIDTYVRHALADREDLSIYTGNCNVTVDASFDSNKLEFDFAKDTKYSERRLEDFLLL